MTDYAPNLPPDEDAQWAGEDYPGDVRGVTDAPHDDRVRATGAIRYPMPRTVANVRAASVAARWVALVVGVLVVLLTVVGAAYVWADPVPSPAPLKSDRGF